MTASSAGFKHRRRNTGGIGYCICIRCPAGTLFSRRATRNESRTNNHWKNIPIYPAVIFKCLYITDSNHNLFAGLNIRHRLRKDIRPLLFQKRCALTGSTGLLINLPGHHAFMNLPVDIALAHHHYHLVYSRIFRQWKDIDSLNLLFVRIVEMLFYLYLSQESGNLRINRGMFKWKFQNYLAVLVYCP